MPSFLLLSAALSEHTTVPALRSRLQEILAADPALPFALNADDSGELLRPVSRRVSALPTDAQAFVQLVNNLHARLVALDRQARVNGLAERFARRDEQNPSMAEFSGDVCEIFSLRGLAGLVVTGGKVQRRATWDAGTPFVPALTAEDVRKIRAGEIQIRPDGVLLPLGGKYRPRAAFWLDAPDRVWLDTDLTLLQRLGHQLGLENERIQAVRYMRSLPALRRELLTGRLEDAYQPLLERALATIPGAECGSLLIREGGVFRYAASVTFDEVELRDVRFSMAHTRDEWYGLGEEAWSKGVPRVLSKGLLSIQGTGYEYRGEHIEAPLESVAGIQANIGVPILYQGEVYGFLNIDSMTDADAFDRESLVLAESFGQQAALLLHEAHLRAQVHAAARTDVLTGLQNRRAFAESLTRELALAHRHHHPLSLLVADIRAFKAVNDTHGHLVGDQALVLVGEVLHRELRASDTVFRPGWSSGEGTAGSAQPTSGLEVFRWGGDEFAVLLPETDLAGAMVVQERLRMAMQGTDVAGQAIELNIGVATLQAGDRDGEGMLREADDGMYRDKQGAR